MPDFTQSLILLLIALLFSKDTLLPALMKKMGWSNGNGETLGKKMDTLSAYYNHETTRKLDDIFELNRETLQILKEIKEYGIPCRDKKV